MSDLRFILEVQRLLDDCPFGVVLGKVITCRGTTEEQIAAWVERLYDIKQRIHDEQQRVMVPRPVEDIDVCTCGRSREAGVHADGALCGHAFEFMETIRG